MTDATPSSSDTLPYIQTWAESAGQALGEITGSACPCRVLEEAPAEFVSVNEADVRTIVVSTGSLRGEMSIRIPPVFVVRLAQIFMSEPANASVELTAEHREAVLELLRQVSGLAASALKAVHGEVQLRVEYAPGAPSWTASSTAWLHLGAEDSPVALVELQLSAALVATLRPEKLESPAAGSVAEHSQPALQDGVGKLDLLMDVELGVMIRFGSRRLLLREVLDLNPGSVIALDRHVQEPADMLLDGRVVARGEVVVVDGNYGLRVTEVGPAAG
jgi:flagellar motor switch protein FliN